MSGIRAVLDELNGCSEMAPHKPTWDFAPDSSAFTLTCEAKGCAWRDPPCLARAALEQTLMTGGALLSLVDPHLKRWFEWHLENA